ncbi:MAG: membrane protein insertase YidC [Candidatus Jacksonbacteria bacterium]|nr:membrane protein insertase YidC [Candidatus Jacksonbacteria bacterium]
MLQLFHTLFYLPIFNILIFLYTFLPIQDMGIAIILLTILVRLALWPLTGRQIAIQKAMKELQPKIEEVKKKYKDDTMKRNEEIMRLYKENKANPASSCLPLLLQLPILLAMYQAFRKGLEEGTLVEVYSFIAKPEMINTHFLSLIDLTKPFILLAFIAAIAQFWQSKMMTLATPATSKDGARDEAMQAAINNKMMLYGMPIMTVIFGWTFPSGVMLYWLTNTVMMGIQQKVELKK